MDHKTKNKFKVAAVQMASGPSVSANLMEAERLIQLAADGGARLVVLPENFSFMGMSEADKLGVAELEGAGPTQDFLAHQAAKHRVWLVGGTIPLLSDNPALVRAASLLFNAEGRCVARYDKMHLFDVMLEESGEQYAESRTIEAGSEVCVIDTELGRIGIAVCYDLRFPELFRRMSVRHADMIVLPSAFTAITGKAHWRHLVCARAIENLCYVIAADQGGYHINGRESYGHSMVVDPWGAVIDCLPSGAGVVIAEIDSGVVTRVRKNFPALEHRRLDHLVQS